MPILSDGKNQKNENSSYFWFLVRFCPKNCIFGWFCDNWGHFYTFLPTKMDENWHTSSTLKADKEKRQFGHSPRIFGPKMAHFCPKNCVFGWFWDNWRHFFIFYYIKWMILGVLHQFLKLKEIKTVSVTFDSFLGHKRPIFGPKTAHFWPKNCVFGWFGDNWRHFYIFSLSKMDNTLRTSSTFKADRDKNSFGYFQLILGPKMTHVCPQKLQICLILVKIECVSILI